MARFSHIDEIEPRLDGRGLRVGIVMSRFNPDICEGLLSACVEELDKLGVTGVRLATVPGALEIPLTLQVMARSACKSVICSSAASACPSRVMRCVACHTVSSMFGGRTGVS